MPIFITRINPIDKKYLPAQGLQASAHIYGYCILIAILIHRLTMKKRFSIPTTSMQNVSKSTLPDFVMTAAVL